jgi:hypothetical protein
VRKKQTSSNCSGNPAFASPWLLPVKGILSDIFANNGSECLVWSFTVNEYITGSDVECGKWQEETINVWLDGIDQLVLNQKFEC